MNYYIIIFSLAIMYLSVADEAPMIKTAYGYLQGKYLTSRNGKTFSAFLGIPYAAPPTGELRFVPPVSPQKWEGVRNATQEGNICSQGKYGGSEDCLYVNVFTQHIQSDELLPVMFYIHGGSFYMGSPSLGITGPDYLMDKAIVLVTVGYRLGPFGFLSTEDSVIPGNMGLKDQVKALQWVQDNINSFGGDPKKVTLFGCSAGGSSVHLHMQSPVSKDLFVGGISQSGTAFSLFALMGRGCARTLTLQLAKHLNCSTENSKLLQCLQQKTTTEIEQAHQNFQNSRNGMTKSIFRPVIEVNNELAFLSSSPLLATTHKPWLTGITANEGILNIRMKYLNYTIDAIKTDFNVYGPKALLFEDTWSRPNNISDHIYDFYFRNASTRDKMVKSIEEMFTDLWYLWPVDEAIHQHHGTLYFYLYDHRGEYSYAEVYDSPRDMGVSHLDDLLSLFKHGQFYQALNDQDTNISRCMVDLWVNFATYGNPTPILISSNPHTTEIADFRWIVSNNTNVTHLHLQTHKLSMQRGIYPDRLEFWRRLHAIEKLI